MHIELCRRGTSFPHPHHLVQNFFVLQIAVTPFWLRLGSQDGKRTSEGLSGNGFRTGLFDESRGDIAMISGVRWIDGTVVGVVTRELPFCRVVNEGRRSADCHEYRHKWFMKREAKRGGGMLAEGRRAEQKLAPPITSLVTESMTQLLPLRGKVVGEL